jgi:biotin carboxyl carrier protein
MSKRLEQETAAGSLAARGKQQGRNGRSTKLIATLNGRECALELMPTLNGATAVAFAVDSLRLEADIQEVEPGVYSVLVGTRSVEAKIERNGDGYAVRVNGRRYEIAVRDPRQRGRLAGRPATEGPQKVTSPMPGKVMRVMVQAGEAVRAGAGLLVVEAMKMQNEIRAPKDGVVAAIHVQVGSSVRAGETMVVVE